ncbi:MAG: DUF3192 domain-containing protein [Victivallaceae bacterium]|nr:DUF3192 domain-containing protein [Victivallaceae bacterium]
MKRLVLLCGIVLIGWLSTVGCHYSEQRRNLENSKKLRINMTREQVLKVMGEPVKGENYVTPDIWYYYINTQWNDGMITEDECMPLVFKNGKLAGWGWNYFEKMRVQRKFGK